MQQQHVTIQEMLARLAMRQDKNFEGEEHETMALLMRSTLRAMHACTHLAVVHTTPPGNPPGTIYDKTGYVQPRSYITHADAKFLDNVGTVDSIVAWCKEIACMEYA